MSIFNDILEEDKRKNSDVPPGYVKMKLAPTEAAANL
jgi:hypothetical protein